MCVSSILGTISPNTDVFNINKGTTLGAINENNDIQIFTPEGFPIHQYEIEGFPPLTVAVIKKNIQMIQLLLNSFEVDANALDPSGLTAMYWAISDPEILEVLARSGKCDPNAGRIFPLETALQDRQVRSVEILLTMTNLEAPIESRGRKAIRGFLIYVLVKESLMHNTTSEELRIIALILKYAKPPFPMIAYSQISNLCQRHVEIREVIQKDKALFWYKYFCKTAQILKIDGTVILYPNVSQKKVLAIFRKIILFRKSLSQQNITLNSKQNVPNVNENLSTLTIGRGGWGSEMFFKKIAKGLENYLKQEKSLLTSPQIPIISQAYRDAFYQNDSSAILNRIKSNELTIIPTGFNGHAVSVVFYKNYYCLCNRGSESRRAVEIYEYDMNRLNVKQIDLIKSYYQRDRIEYKKLFFDDLPKQLSFLSSPLTHLLEEISVLPPQLVGNCAWESAETSVLASLLLTKILDKSTDHPTEHALEGIKNGALKEKQSFFSWLAFQQVNELENLLSIRNKEIEYKIPQNFICNAFCNSEQSSSKSNDKNISKKLSKLKKEFFNPLSTKEKIQFITFTIFLKIKKAVFILLCHLFQPRSWFHPQLKDLVNTTLSREACRGGVEPSS